MKILKWLTFSIAIFIVVTSVYLLFSIQKTNATAWDISTAGFVASTSTLAQDTVPRSVFFKDDGTKMYVAGDTNDKIFEYNLLTPWDVTTASFFQSTSTKTPLGTISNPRGMFFKADGLSLYVQGAGAAPYNAISQYSLSSAWDISTAAWVRSISTLAQDTVPVDITFDDTGAKMYMHGFANKKVYQYALSTPWNIATASFLRSTSTAAQDSNPRSVNFKPDGLTMYTNGYTGAKIYQYSLSTAWDISTASFFQSLSTAGQDGDVQDVFFHSSGTKMYALGYNNKKVYQYNFNTPPTTAVSTPSHGWGAGVSAGGALNW